MSKHIFKNKYITPTISIIMVIYVAGSMCSYCIALMDNMYWW